MLLYYITDRGQFPGGEAEQQRRVLGKIAEAAAAGVDYIQLREKDLPARSLEQLAREVIKAVRDNSANTKLLINSRIDVALACGADGVHLTSTDIPAGDARAMWTESRQLTSTGSAVRDPAMASLLVVSSTHSADETELAFSQGADFAVFGPVFEKVTAPARTGVGLPELRRVCTQLNRKRNPAKQQHSFPVLALGGITVDNAPRCMKAGAAGVAAIRLFQENDVAAIVAALREPSARTL